MVKSESFHGWSSWGGKARSTPRWRGRIRATPRWGFGPFGTGIGRIRSGQKRVDDESEETADLRRQRFRPVDHGDGQHGGDQVRRSIPGDACVCMLAPASDAEPDPDMVCEMEPGIVSGPEWCIACRSSAFAGLWLPVIGVKTEKSRWNSDWLTSTDRDSRSNDNLRPANRTQTSIDSTKGTTTPIAEGSAPPPIM